MTEYLWLECRPDCYQTWYEQGNKLRQENCYSEALVCYDRALTYSHDSYYVWYYRGRILESLNHIEEALFSLQTACQIQPHNYWAWYDQGFIWQKYYSEYQRSIFCFNEALQNNTQTEEYWAVYRLGKSYFKIKKYLLALDYFRQALQIRPEDYWSYYWQGESQKRIRLYSHAEKSYLQALKIKPNDYWVLYQLASLKQHLCLYQEAIYYYHQLQYLGFELNPAIIYQIRSCYSILGIREYGVGSRESGVPSRGVKAPSQNSVKISGAQTPIV